MTTPIFGFERGDQFEPEVRNVHVAIDSASDLPPLEHTVEDAPLSASPSPKNKGKLSDGVVEELETPVESQREDVKAQREVRSQLEGEKLKPESIEGFDRTALQY